MPPIDRMLGKRVGPYRLVRKIAEGGFGMTYEGRHELRDLPVCIKWGHECEQWVNDLLVDEAAALWDLRHIGLPAVRDLVPMEDGRLALVMSFIPGLTIEHAVQKVMKKTGRGIPPKHVAWIVERALNVLWCIHGQGIMHGDIKPGNVMLQHEKHIVVMVDFGLSVIRPTIKTRPKGWMEDFSPPEQIAGDKSLLPESDFYSLGRTISYMLNGNLDDVRAERIPSSVPAPLRDFVGRLTRHEISRRPSKAGVLIEEIRDIREHYLGGLHTNFEPIPGLDD